ncbi:class D beta-lactamase [Arcobacteraceae bacterium]|nr:class D beta-lactamase [Arcobacteraceae bacterium]
MDITMTKILSLLLFCVTLLSSNNKSFENIFNKYNIDGTLVVTSLKSDELYLYNQKRAHKRVPAASTFKIPHTLIALNENLITSQSDIIKWDGIKRGYHLWNKDQTLQSAISVSCVWCYKKFTQKISKEKYLNYLSKFNYGNKTVGKDKSSFWLNGDLKISAYEQIEFLKKLYTENLPISKKHINIVKKIITIDKNNQYELKAKSGWDGTIGWYVGYVKTNGKVYFFALNADIKKEQLSLRKELIYEALKSINII